MPEPTEGVYLFKDIVPNVKHIGIIDDDKLTLMLTEKLLKSWFSNIKVSTFLNAALALETFTTNPSLTPDLILLDINMPDVNGWDFLILASKKNLNLHISMFSSSIDEADIQKSRTYSMVHAFITKPITKEKILSVIELG